MYTVSKCIKYLQRCEREFDEILLYDQELKDSEVSTLLTCLLDRPDAIKDVYMCENYLTDETGVKVARLVSSSSTIRFLSLACNDLSETTYLTMAAALRVNSSLLYLYMYNNKTVDQRRIDREFVDVLRVNPIHSYDSRWFLYTLQNNVKRLTRISKKSSPPSMLEFLLYVHFDRKMIQTIKH